MGKRSVAFCGLVCPFPVYPRQCGKFSKCICCMSSSTSKDQERKTRSRGDKRSALYHDMARYASHFKPLLEAELASEQAHYESAGRAPMLRNVKIYERGRLMGDAVFVLRSPDSKQKLSSECELRKGDLVFIRYDTNHDPAGDDNRVEALVLERTLGTVSVAVPIGSESASTLALMSSQNAFMKVEQGINCIANERAQAAIAAITDRSHTVSQIAIVIVRSLAQSDERLLTENALPRVPTEQAVSCNVKKKEETPWENFARAFPAGVGRKAVSSAHNKVCTIYDPPTLVQRSAIRDALFRTLTLIQGPPGTGKTMTAAYMMVGAVFAGCGPVLATAPSNVAVDNILEKVIWISGNGLGVVRVGRTAAVRENLWEYTLEGHLERNPTVRRAREAVLNDSSQLSVLRKLEQEISRQILRRADIVFTTCVGAGHELFDEVEFRFVVCDEASQATEPDSLIPVVAGAGSCCRQLVLVGDHHQLPPTVLSNNLALSQSLFGRLWHSGVFASMLDTQYRMHRQIAKFPVKHFYFGRVRTKVQNHHREFTKKDGAPSSSFLETLLSEKRVVFIDVLEGRERSDRSTAAGGEAAISPFSYVNLEEAAVVLRVVRELPFLSKDIAVISPYVGQIRALSRILRDEYADVEVSTVDGFQGREKDAIIFSTVRSNENQALGFLSDWRRLNVGITRARSALVVVGSGRTLKNDPFWAKWLDVALRCDSATFEKGDLQTCSNG